MAIFYDQRSKLLPEISTGKSQKHVSQFPNLIKKQVSAMGFLFI